MKLLCFYSFLFFGINSFSQLNIDSLSHVNYQTLHDANLNDLWAYVDEAGNEYAIVGTSKGTSIINVTDPSNPVEVFWVGGSTSIWRDPCVYGDYAYVTTEAEDGLTIIDLSPLPASTVLPTTLYTGPVGSEWQSAHTCTVDENGFAYIFGSNRGNGGVIILDVITDPMNPIEVGTFDNWYVHDGFVRNDTMYLAHISDGFFSLVDISDFANPILLGTQTTPNNFTHNIWPTDDGKFVFTTDEVTGAFIACYDITDPLNIVEVDRTQHSPGQGVPPHNTHVLNNFLITSYYSDGITIHDITYPNNMILVGEYDTYPTQTSGFDGCWGVYPFLPSGTVLASDITQGLFILGPTYEQASYLEGLITDVSTTNPISNVNVQIVSNDHIDQSIWNGTYATGILGVGTYSVVYSKVGYFSQTIDVVLNQGTVVTQDVQLVPIPPFNLNVNVVEQGTMTPVSNAQILLSADLLDHTGITNGIGQEDFVLYYQEEYMVTVGKWGYVTSCYNQVIDENTLTITVEMVKGYHDEFSFDFGWISAGTATTGLWERGKPNVTNSGSAPTSDADYDCGEFAYVTGNDYGLYPDLDDVDGGYAMLISPTMDLTSYTDPYLNYSTWFYCMFGAVPDDTMTVMITNGFSSVVVDQIGPDPSQFFQWHPKSIRLLDYVALTSSMQVLFKVPDMDPDVNITEGGVDYFYISNENVLGNSISENSEITIYPNPAGNEISISNGNIGQMFEILNSQGKVVLSGSITEENMQISVVHLSSGIYFVKYLDQIKMVMKE